MGDEEDPHPGSQPEVQPESKVSGPLHGPVSPILSPQLAALERNPWSHLKPDHVECICQAVHAGVLISCLSGRRRCEPPTPSF